MPSIRKSLVIFAVVTFALLPASAAPPSHVDITWLSVSNIYYEIGSLRILTDGYISRIPKSEFYGGGGGLAHTHDPYTPDVKEVTRVLSALGGPKKINLLLTGHSHFDHTFDTPTWARLTGARIIGSKTTCFQALAEKIPSSRCTAVFGREKFRLASGVTMYVVRWNHSGSADRNPEQHNPVELESVPIPDTATGGLRGGVAEDFPNGGGARGFLFTVDGPNGRFSWFFQNSASPTDLDVPIVVDGTNYGAPIENLKAAMHDAGVDSVDLWIGSGGAEVAKMVVPILKPKAFLPVHWDSFFQPFATGVTKPYADAPLEGFLNSSRVKLIKPVQYMDKWRLDRSGVRAIPNVKVKQALGFKDPS